MTCCDRGLLNREKIYTETSAAPFEVIDIELEAPYHSGKVKRAGSIRKCPIKSAIRMKQVLGLEDMHLFVVKMNVVNDDMVREDEFLPLQGYLGKMPRRLTGEVMDSEDFADIGSTQRAEYRKEYTKEFIHAGDSKRLTTRIATRSLCCR